MAAAPTTAPVFENVADLLERLGQIAPQRIRLRPPPGQATEADVLTVLDRDNRLCELVDGTLVEKVMGFSESFLAAEIVREMGTFARSHDLGIVTGADGTIRLLEGLVRIPDVAFISWDRLPGRRLPTRPIPDLAPDLAVEVLSEGNTPGEMERKLKEYFLAGTRLVWFVDPARRTAEAYTSPETFTTINESQDLDGADVLPGFRLPLAALLERFPAPPKPRGKRPRDKKP
jgi:Uma2 family endonuclease